MEITWLGRTCFRLKGREGTVVLDPFPPGAGYQLGKPAAEVVTISHRSDPNCSYHEGVGGNPIVFDAPGEYEVGGILLTGIATKGPGGDRNVVFVVELEGMKVAHLGSISAEDTRAATIDDVKGVDVLLLPAGGGNSLGGAIAADLMTTINPKLVIPMNFRANGEGADTQDTLERFLKELGAKPEPEPKITVTRSQLPAELAVRLLSPTPVR